MTVLLVLGFMLVSCIIVVCILSYCKARILKNTERMSNPRNHISSESRSRPRNTIFVVPTTSQVIEMYVNVTQANSAAINNANNSQVDSSVRRPPSYGTVIVDVPPTYEQAIQQLDNERK